MPSSRTISGTPSGNNDFVVVANRLPVDRVVADDGSVTWTRSPGGLVTALEPVMQSIQGAWVGWTGSPDDAPEPFTHDQTFLVPIRLSADDIRDFYEGFSNGTLWPLYHDVIASPAFHRHWWEAYVSVNERFARAAARAAAPGATVWVHDYQLQLVPRILRELRDDLQIGYFHHIPFPPWELFAQLPWRRQIIEGLLGADLIGFQRDQDAGNLLRAARRGMDLPSRRGMLSVEDPTRADGTRSVTAHAFPISIDSTGMRDLAASPEVRARAAQIRADLGHPKHLILGVDRLDYTKGLAHRLKAYGELLNDGRLDSADTVFVQVATPSRERVEDYRKLRDEIELMAGRINGQHATLHRAAVVYLHHSYPKEEMAALYSAADVMLVTPLRDGMNLVAKEYVACRNKGDGVLILSEFTGAAVELKRALLVNPHDIDGLKDVIEEAVRTPTAKARRRMQPLRNRVLKYDVRRWADDFLAALAESRGEPSGRTPVEGVAQDVDDALRGLAERTAILAALDFDGVLAPIVDDPARSQLNPRSRAAIKRLLDLPGVHVAFVSGRKLAELRSVARPPEGVRLVGSHGAEFDGAQASLTPEQLALLDDLGRRLDEVAARYPGARVERKPTTVVLHTRLAGPADAEAATAAVLDGPARLPRVHALRGKDVVELSVVTADKGQAIASLAGETGAEATLYIGDDATDEFALRRLEHPRDVGIKVGPGETAAHFRVGSPDDVAEVLTRLADLLEPTP